VVVGDGELTEAWSRAHGFTSQAGLASTNEERPATACVADDDLVALGRSSEKALEDGIERAARALAMLTIHERDETRAAMDHRGSARRFQCPAEIQHEKQAEQEEAAQCEDRVPDAQPDA
jgi:flavin-binding protein dodecin